MTASNTGGHCLIRVPTGVWQSYSGVITLLTDNVCLYQQPPPGHLTDAVVSTDVSSLASWTLPPLLFTSIVNKPQLNYLVGLQQVSAVSTKIMPVRSLGLGQIFL